MKVSTKGFTLIELIIVIGIIAVLGTVSVLALNPAQLFAQARDTTRISDLGTLQNAINLYVSDAATPDMDGTGGAFTCGTNFGASVAGATDGFVGTPILAQAGVRTTGGLGWVPIVFSGMTGGSPLAVLPIDPTNTTAFNYQYSCNNTAKTFELNTTLESTKYTTGAGDRVTTDGGDNATAFEVGSSLVL